MKYDKDLNGRIIITNDHIARVPRPKIYNNIDLDRRIQLCCKEVLKLSMQRNDGHRNDEVMVLLNVDQNRIAFSKLGYSDLIMLTQEESIAYDSAIDLFPSDRYVIIHNHPSDVRLSLNDITLLIESYDVYACVAVVNNGNIHYMVKSEFYTNKLYYSRLPMALTKKLLDPKTNLIEFEEKFYINLEKFKLRYHKSVRRRL